MPMIMNKVSLRYGQKLSRRNGTHGIACAIKILCMQDRKQENRETKSPCVVNLNDFFFNRQWSFNFLPFLSHDEFKGGEKFCETMTTTE